MKKLLIGFVCGALLMFSGQALAEEISMIGKKVGSEATVVVDGVEVSNAVIIDSKSYAPVRDIVDQFDGQVTWQEGKGGERSVITIARNERDITSPSELLNHDLLLAKQRKLELEKQISDLQSKVKGIETDIIPRIEAIIAKYPDVPANADRYAEIEKYKQEVTEAKDKITTLETELKEVVKKIAELESTE